MNKHLKEHIKTISVEYIYKEEKLKRVGIITFHCADNFGAVLQVYALQLTLKELKINSEIIDFRPDILKIPYDNKFHWKYMISKIGLYKTIKRNIVRVIRHKNIKNRMLAFNNFRKNHLIVSGPTYNTSKELMENSPIYEYYITGSDQVWNPDFLISTGNSYFLDFAPKESKKISYAASISVSLESSSKSIFKENINGFNHISIREKDNIEFLESITDKPITIALDPTLLIDKSNYMNISKKADETNKYILVYDIQFNEEMIKLANRISEEKGYDVISFSNEKNYKRGIKTFYYEGPSEFLGYIENAEIVLSTSFHGVALSVIYNKPFYAIPHTTRGTRVTDFLMSIGLEKRIFYKSNELSEISYEIDFSKPNKLLNQRKLESINFLTTALDIDNSICY